MRQVVTIGNQDFEKIITNDYFYIDKTSMIKEWWESGDSVTLITRPRRFGKTLNMDMLKCFFSVEYSEKSELFYNLNIWRYGKYRELQGTYPVIFLSFAGVKEGNANDVKMHIKALIARLYEQNNIIDIQLF